MGIVKRLVVFLLLMSICAVPSLLPADEAVTAEPPAAKKATAKKRCLVNISEETTRITSPLCEDGYVDYVGALNELCSEGVTPENNAVVPLWQAMGSERISEEIRDRYFQLLGIPPLPEKGDYFISFDDYLDERGVENNEETEQQFQRSQERAWSEEEHPLVAGWLKANEKPLRSCVKASRCERYYSPLVSNDGMVISILLPACLEMRSAARALTARALLRLEQGNTDQAQQDLLACHRLGRLSGQGMILVDALVSLAIDGSACQGDTALAQSGKLTAEQAQKYRAELRRLAPLPQMIDKIDTGERFMFLDCVVTIARKGPHTIGQILDGNINEATKTEKLFDWAASMVIDWDEILRTGNSYYDRMVEGGKKPTRAERLEASAEWEKEVDQITNAMSDPKSIAKTLLSGKSPRQIATRKMSGLFVALLLPAVSAAADAEYHGTMRLEMAQLAFALAAYHGDHDRYPARLKQLVPKYIDAVPKDAFSEGPLQYKRRDNGYLLYSVGRNGKDDGGRNYHDDPGTEHDDITIRMPPK